MKRKIALLALLVTILFGCQKESKKSTSWSLILKQAGKANVEVVQLPDDLSKPFTFQKDVEGVNVQFSLEPKEKFTVFKATASGEASVHFSLHCNYTNQVPYNFTGQVDTTDIYRQSPHDVNAWIVKQIAEQAVPMVALKSDSGFLVALNGSPALYDNYTSQSFYLEQKYVELSSGDNGEAPGLKPDTTKQLGADYNLEKTQVMAPGKILPYYHKITSSKPHVFEGIIFESKATNINGLRKDVNYQAASHFSGGKYKDYFGALAFTTAYMNLRANETGKSKYWVVPSVEYGNTQYCRDAFWISTMLAPEYSAECIKSELQKVDNYAEYPLVSIIWAYRAMKSGNEVDLAKVQAYVDAIEGRVKNNYFYSYLESDGRLDFQYWGDVIAFDKDDVVTYNQGLLALALAAAKEMGLKIKSDPDKALLNYKNLFNKELGFYPISKKKNMILGPDPVVPDLIAQMYFGKQLLDDATVKQHYDKVIQNSKTKYGIKVVSMPNGDFLPDELYNVDGYVSQVNREKMPDGRYFKGGSYYLYDNLFLIDAYLHGIKEAEEQLIWRTSLDFSIGSTTYECLNTVTGEPWKPNMGWNVAIYYFWRKLMDEGKADDKLFKHIDEIVANN